MPKKNAFMVYAQEFKEKQQKKGITYGSTAELVTAASPSWNKLKPDEKAKYKADKASAPTKYTSFGQSLSEIEAQEKEVREAEERQLREIRNMVELNNSIKDQDFYVMDVNYFCFTNKGYVICESTIVRFNLADGLLDEYHEMVHPGSIPYGYASDAKEECKNLGMEMPFGNEIVSDYEEILSRLVDYLGIQKTTPPIFTMPDKVAPVEDFIQQLCNNAGQPETLFRVYKLPKLFYLLANGLKLGTNEGFPRESLATDQLVASRFILTGGLACDHHEPIDKALVCSASRVKCWVYTVLDHCCPLAGIEMVPGKHLPKQFDLQKIHDHKTKIHQSQRETVAAMRGLNMSMDSTSSASTAIDLNSSLKTMGSAVKVRVHQPVRAPKADFLAAIQSNTTFGCGRGQGRKTQDNLPEMQITQREPLVDGHGSTVNSEEFTLHNPKKLPVKDPQPVRNPKVDFLSMIPPGSIGRGRGRGPLPGYDQSKPGCS